MITRYQRGRVEEKILSSFIEPYNKVFKIIISIVVD